MQAAGLGAEDDGQRPPPASAAASAASAPRGPGVARRRARRGADDERRCPRPPRAGSARDARAVEHVPGAVGQRARRRRRRGPAAADQPQRPRAPCSSWRGTPRPRWPAARGRTSTTSTRVRDPCGPRVYNARPMSLRGRADRVRLLRPLPAPARAPLSRPASSSAWVAQMGVLAPPRLPPGAARDAGRRPRALRQLGAQWKGIYYRGEKIGFIGRPDHAHRRRLRDPARTAGSR